MGSQGLYPDPLLPDNVRTRNQRSICHICLPPVRLNSTHNIYVKIVAAYTLIALVAIEIPYFFVLCRPFSQYWAMPVHNPQCASYWNYCIIQMVFNVSSDLLTLLVPLPFVVGAHVPPAKKVLLAGIFSLGIFVILAAILNKVYNFTSPNVTVYMLWDIRETSTAVYVANMMCWWPLLRKLFGKSAFLRDSFGSKKNNIIVIDGISNQNGMQLGDLQSGDFLKLESVSDARKAQDVEAEPGARPLRKD